MSIRQTLWLAVTLAVASTALGAGGLLVWQLRRGERIAEHGRVVAVAEAYAAQLAVEFSAGPAGGWPTRLRAWAWHPDSVLLAILDSRGETLAVRGYSAPLAEYLERFSGASLGGKANAVAVQGRPAAGIPALTLAAVPIRVPGDSKPVGTLVYASRPPATRVTAADPAWRFSMGLVLTAATGLIMGFCLIRQNLLAPLAHLARLPAEANGTARLPVGRSDELGELARALAGMRQDVAGWQERAADLEHSLKHRFDLESQRMSQQLRQVERKVWMDPLTRLGNRRLLDEKCEELFQAQRDGGQDLSAVMIDVDHFKTLNDTMGHKAGDELLQFIGDLLRQCVREGDLAVRYGGDEFVLILPGAPVGVAQAVAERTIRLFAQRASLFPITPKPSMSAGVASLHEHRPGSAMALLQRADQALYAAKNGGRSQVCVFKAGRISMAASKTGGR
ncbi:MAG: hypothetical protein AMXMBFR13_30290 [Phycisphaerae bacterium]